MVAGAKWEAESGRGASREHERRTTANSGVAGRCCAGTGEGELDALAPEAGAKQGCCRDEVSEESRSSPQRGRNEGKQGSEREGAKQAGGTAMSGPERGRLAGLKRTGCP